MRTWLRRLGPSLLALGLAAPATSVTLGLDFVEIAPTPALISPGSSVFLDLEVSGLSDPPPPGDGAPSLTAIELDIAYDDTILSLVSFDFVAFPVGTSLVNTLGDPCTFANLDGDCDVLLDWDTGTSGLVELAATSLLDPSFVNASQPASGAIATFEFLALAPGTSALTFSQTAASGTTAGTNQGSFAVSAPPGSVTVAPEPGTALLLGLGLAGTSRLRRRARPATRARAPVPVAPGSGIRRNATT